MTSASAIDSFPTYHNGANFAQSCVDFHMRRTFLALHLKRHRQLSLQRHFMDNRNRRLDVRVNQAVVAILRVVFWSAADAFVCCILRLNRQWLQDFQSSEKIAKVIVTNLSWIDEFTLLQHHDGQLVVLVPFQRTIDCRRAAWREMFHFHSVHWIFHFESFHRLAGWEIVAADKDFHRAD